MTLGGASVVDLQIFPEVHGTVAEECLVLGASGAKHTHLSTELIKTTQKQIKIPSD